MAKGSIARLGKLKCMLKRWHHAASSKYHQPATSDDESTWNDADKSHETTTHQYHPSSPPHADHAMKTIVPAGMHPVYVGKSRRRYLISSRLVDHPLFRVLVQKSGGSEGEEDGSPSTVVVGCEVVLFEHLLWMLENGDPQPESLDELVDFYAC